MLRTWTVLCVLSLLAAGCAYVARASVDSFGVESSLYSSDPAISGDGRYIAFESRGNQLAPGASNSTTEIFRRDIVDGVTIWVSQSTAGGYGAQPSLDPAISADGRFIAFGTQSPLVPGDTNGLATDILVRDVVAGTTTRVSVDSAGQQSDGPSEDAAISNDGRYVAFLSGATNLVPDDTNGEDDVFVHDRDTGTTTRVNVDSAGNQSVGPAADELDISPDGRYITFMSYAADLVPGDTNGESDIFLHDTVTGSTTRVSVDSAGTQANDFNTGPVVSADGRFVAFQSSATNLVAGPLPGPDIYRHDTVTGATVRVSDSYLGGDSNGIDTDPSISDDGRFVAFDSTSTDLLPAGVDTNGENDVYVRDMDTGAMSLLSTTATSGLGNDRSDKPNISANGRYVAYQTQADNLVADDTNGYRDVLVTAIPRPAPTSLTPSTIAAGTSVPITVTGTGFASTVVLAIYGESDGITFSSVTLVSPTEITATATIPAGAPAGARTVMVISLGSGPGYAVGFCPFCLAVN